MNANANVNVNVNANVNANANANVNARGEYAKINEVFRRMGASSAKLGQHWSTVRALVDNGKMVAADVENLLAIREALKRKQVPIDAVLWTELNELLALPAEGWYHAVKKGARRIRKSVVNRPKVTGFGKYGFPHRRHERGSEPHAYAGPEDLANVREGPATADGKGPIDPNDPPVQMTTSQLPHFNIQTVEYPFLGPKGMHPLRMAPDEDAYEVQIPYPGGEYVTAPGWLFEMDGNQRFNLDPVGHIFLRELAVGQVRRWSLPAHVVRSVVAGLRRCDFRFTFSFQRSIENLRLSGKTHNRKFSLRDIEVSLGFAFFSAKEHNKANCILEHLTHKNCQEVAVYHYTYDIRRNEATGEDEVISRDGTGRRLEIDVGELYGSQSRPIKVSKKKTSKWTRQVLWTRAGSSPDGVPIYECQSTKFYGVREELERLQQQQFDIIAEIDEDAASGVVAKYNPSIIDLGPHDDERALPAI
ncbi:hypothetical protein N0V82_006017 [Gnomoniopsis sp. IMI 355080]|nr:hypothetical protein N0V82_006017 [Gnomoniopsis sp. IMI 355080]